MSKSVAIVKALARIQFGRLVPTRNVMAERCPRNAVYAGELASRTEMRCFLPQTAQMDGVIKGVAVAMARI